MEFEFNDGGRKEAGYKGATGDCGTRAIAIVTGMPYKDVRVLVNSYGSMERITKNKRKKSTFDTGIFTETMKKIMKDLGWTWTATMGIGTGCTVHLKQGELPKETLIVRVSKHYVAYKDGKLQDTYDSSREGTRCVYGYWSKPEIN